MAQSVGAVGVVGETDVVRAERNLAVEQVVGINTGKVVVYKRLQLIAVGVIAARFQISFIIFSPFL